MSHKNLGKKKPKTTHSLARTTHLCMRVIVHNCRTQQKVPIIFCLNRGITTSIAYNVRNGTNLGLVTWNSLPVALLSSDMTEEKRLLENIFKDISV